MRSVMAFTDSWNPFMFEPVQIEVAGRARLIDPAPIPATRRFNRLQARIDRRSGRHHFGGHRRMSVGEHEQ
jgi:hypothetical protein